MVVIPLCILGVIVFFIFCLRHRRQKSGRHHNHHSHSSNSVKSSIQPRQALLSHHGAIIPSTTTRTSNDYISNSVDSIPIARQYQPHRYGPPLSSDLASLTSSSLYYARVQAM